MRKLLSCLVLASLLGAAWAQTEDSHRVTVDIPHILRLRIGDEASRSHAFTPVRIHVAGTRYRIEPSGTEVEVLANTAWQLSTRYAPSSPRDAGARLSWQLDNGTWHSFSDYDQLVTQGTATGGWRSLHMNYGLETPLPPNGNYQGVITFTLARP